MELLPRHWFSLPVVVLHDVIEGAAHWGVPFLLKKHES